MPENQLPVATGQVTSLATLHPPEPGERGVAYVARMMELLPPPDDEVIDRIAESILRADAPSDENEIWESVGSRDCIGKRFIFHSVHINPSDFENGPLPWYLVCRVTDMSTGEETVLTTGSVNICTSLVKAQLLGNLPWEAEIVGPRRVPKSGHVPLHLRWMARIVERDA